MADCALKVLTTPELHAMMSRAGRARMGKPGALDSVVEYVGRELGWNARCEVYEKLHSLTNRDTCKSKKVDKI